jgi:hypothetical protein
MLMWSRWLDLVSERQISRRALRASSREAGRVAREGAFLLQASHLEPERAAGVGFYRRETRI